MSCKHPQSGKQGWGQPEAGLELEWTILCVFVYRCVCFFFFIFWVFLLVGCKTGSYYVAQAALKLVIWTKADLKLLIFLPPFPKFLNRAALVRPL